MADVTEKARQPLGTGWGKPLVFVLCLLPLAAVVYGAVLGDLGPDPVKALIVMTGDWAIRALLVVFSVSALRSWLGWSRLLRFRRMLGLFAGFYASLHILVVATYLFAWDWTIVLEELSERPYIIAGFAAWLLMLPMVVTSNNYSVRRLGRRWRQLHQLMYPVMGLAWLHVVWQVRSSYLEALIYGLLIVVLALPRLRRFQLAR